MNNRFQNRNQNHNNFRGGDNRRGYHHNGVNNRYRNTDRMEWNDGKGQNEWRSDRDHKDLTYGNRKESRHHSSQSTHFPGIPVNRNQTTTPFVSSDPKVDNCANGCGDAKGDLKVESISNQMSKIEIKSKDTDTQTDITSTEKEVPKSVTPVVSESVSPPEVKTESQSEVKSETKVIPNNGSVANTQRRNTITGSEYRFQNRVYYRNGNETNTQMNGQRVDRFHNYNNKMQTIDTNRRTPQNNTNTNNNNNFRGNSFRKYPQKNDFVNYMPINPYVGSNLGEGYNPLTQYLFPNSYFNNAYGYGAPSPLMAPNAGEMAPEMNRQNHSDVDRSGKYSDQSSSSGKTHYSKAKLMNESSDMSGFATHFVPFKPSPQIPVAPQYFGNIIPYNTDKGVTFYFQSVIPPNIALLPLEIEQSTGLPILPSNCFTVMPYYD